jgi:isocitrate dehydrogenase (NAD+)
MQTFPASGPIPATLIMGDGIGPEITRATVRVLAALEAPFVWDERPAGLGAHEKYGDPLPEETLASIRKNMLALKGPLTTPIGGGFRSVNVRLREEFKLYANVRPARTFVPGGRFDNIDLVLIRENTEGLYVGVEHFVPVGDDPHAVAEASGIMTRYGCRRVAEFAFHYVVTHQRRKLTIVHKANILKKLTGLFLETALEVGERYKGQVEVEDRIVDNTAMQLILNPNQFDVLLAPNMFGDILSDEIAGLVGGLGLAPSGNIGTDAAIFEAVHGSAPDIAGKGIANPAALMLASAMMLEHVGRHDQSVQLRTAIDHVLRDDGVRTRDLGGDVGTEAFADAVIARL